MADVLTLQRLAAFVRAYIRDYEEVNRVVEGLESSDKDIKIAALACLSDFNNTPPLTTYTIATFPSTHLLLIGTIIELLYGIGILQTRNWLPASGEGVASPDNPQFNLAWVNRLEAKYEKEKKQLKVYINIRQCQDLFVSSDYAVIGQEIATTLGVDD
jgi:hypothetical protein